MTRRLARGSRLGKYRLERKLGVGGSATVWQARDTIEGRRVAVKVVHPAVVEELGREAIENEARLVAQLDHPRVVAIRNADWVDGLFLMVTDLATSSLDGSAAARRSPKLAISILRDVAEGLAYAHGEGLIHRDIKPANIFLYEGRRAKLGDFGTARLAPPVSRKATEVGTFGYMAPEQAYGRPRYASDVFSLSLTAYELLSGVLPSWPFEWPLEGHARLVKRCPPAVAGVLQHGLAIDLDARWHDGIEFHRELVRAIEQSADSGSRRDRRTVRSARRRRRPPPDPFALEASWFRKEYGKTFDAKYDCCLCEGPIAESMSFCPWCGTQRNSFVEITTYPLVCPDCERGVRPEWRACPRCSTGRFESNGRAIRGDARTNRRCRRVDCRAPLQPFMRYCPACKTRVARPWKLPGLASCARCDWAIAPRWRFCAWCGRRDAGALDVARTRGRRR